MRKSGAGDGKIIASNDLEQHGGVPNEALDQVAEAVLVLDREFRITYVNPAFEHLLGYSPEDVLGKPLSILSVPGQLDSLQPEEIARRVHESGWWHGEVRRRAKDGSAIPFRLTASAVRDERGGVTGYVGTYLDLREIRRAEQRFQSLIEHSSDIITLFDSAGTVLYVSPSVQRVLGHAPEALLGKAPFILVHPDDVSDARRVLTEALQNPDKTYHLEFRLRHADGRYVDVEAVGSSLSGDATAPSVVFSARDITERKRVERALAESEEKFRSISAAANDAILVIDNDGRLMYWNPAAERIFGYRAEEALGQDAHQLFVPSRYHADFERGFAEFRKSGTGPVIGNSLELAALRKDGSEFPVELSISALRRNDRWHAVGIVRDITERKQTETVLRESKEKFQALVETTTDWVWQIDENNVYTYASPLVREILGYSPEEIIGKTPFDLMPPAEATQIRAAHQSMVATRKPFRLLENVNLHKDGRLVVLETSGVPIFDAAGAYKGCRGIDRDITARKQAEDALRHANRALKALSACNSMLVHAVDETRLFSDMCRILVETGGYSHAWIGNVEHDAAKRIRPVARAGFASDFPQEPALTWADNEAGQSPVGIAVRKGMAMVVRDALHDPALAFWRPTLAQLGVNAICVFPLIYGGETFGVLSVYSSERDAFGQDELELLAELADDLNFGVLTLRTSIERDRAVEQHQHSLEQLRESLEATIGAIAATLEMRDPYTAGHERRVAELATAIAREMALPQDKIEGIHFGALIHDLGKIKAPAEILSKPTALTKPEFDLIKEHALSGYDILKGIRFPWPVAEMALQHHERIDGSGYPNGLKGHEMKVESRILAVADVVEAMASHRPYRPALGVEAALVEINTHRGTWYDADAVDACMRLFKEKGFTLDHP